MVHMGLVGQYFSELDPNYDGPPRAADPSVQARKLVGMERRDVILTAVFGTLGALGVLFGLGLAAWLYLRARRSKQREADLEDQDGMEVIRKQPQTKKNGFLNLKTPLISTKALGKYNGSVQEKMYIGVSESQLRWNSRHSLPECEPLYSPTKIISWARCLTCTTTCLIKPAI